MNLPLKLTKNLQPFFHQKLVLGVSGGLDSMALLQLFLHFRKHFQCDFSVAYFHHGPCEQNTQQEYRWAAYDLVNQVCRDNQIPFFSNHGGGDRDPFLKSFATPLQSEAQCREARYTYFTELREGQGFSHLVLAHHQGDLLETRLHRLIRGTGPDGLNAMQFQEGWLLRPFLEVERRDLAQFLQHKQGAFVEDPSNQDLRPFRNWLRHHWLEELEKRSPGAQQSLARSLDHLVSSLGQPDELQSLADQSELPLSELLSLPQGQRRQVLASYMKGQGLKNYGVSHINEILKRLDREQKSHTFQLLGRRWNVDAGRMSLQPLAGIERNSGQC